METTKTLRTGYTTGTCAAAAAAATIDAYFGNLTGNMPESEDIRLPGMELATIPVYSIKIEKCGHKNSGASKLRFIARIKKDAGDDPDITNGAIIGASLMMREGGTNKIYIRGGEGVGTVTRPGLPVKAGRPAINPVPLYMIRQAVMGSLFDNRRAINMFGGYTIFITIFVENGEELAKKTLNLRLGIVGGISILGTTGIVKPFSAKSYRDTIEICLRSAKELKLSACVLSTGRGSEKRTQVVLKNLPEASFVQIADFFAFSLKKARENGFKEIILSCFFGKLCKWALELEYTHAHTKQTDFDRLAEFAREDGMSENFVNFVRGANTSREIYESAHPEKEKFIGVIGEKALEFARKLTGPETKIFLYCFDFKGSSFHKWG